MNLTRNNNLRSILWYYLEILTISITISMSRSSRSRAILRRNYSLTYTTYNPGKILERRDDARWVKHTSLQGNTSDSKLRKLPATTLKPEEARQPSCLLACRVKLCGEWKEHDDTFLSERESATIFRFSKRRFCILFNEFLSCSIVSSWRMLFAGIKSNRWIERTFCINNYSLWRWCHEIIWFMQ